MFFIWTEWVVVGSPEIWRVVPPRFVGARVGSTH